MMKTSNMGGALLSDLYKMKKLKSVWIGLILMFALTFLLYAMYWMGLSVIEKRIAENPLDAETIQMQSMLISLGHQLLMGFSSSGGMMLYIAIICGIFIGNDFSSGNIGIITARGGKRVQLYFSKWISIMLLTVIYCLFSLLISGIFTAFKGYGAPFTGKTFGTLMRCLSLQILAHMSAASIFIMISFLVRSAGASVGANIGIFIVLNLIFSIASTVVLSVGGNADFIMFMPLQQVDVAAKYSAYTTAELCAVIIMPIVYLALSTLIGATSFIKRDIK